ncbi:MAG: YqgE/AlgH family protein [Flavobacteriales bacterium]|nr:YqgE/AlgH family protein [Flavobacteriales bacterium]
MNKGRAFDKFFNQLDFSNGEPACGKLLISEPFLADPNFNHTVILLVRHNEEGSLGFVLNNPSPFTINEVVDSFPPFGNDVGIGGPVGVNSLFYIHKIGEKLAGSYSITDGLYWGGDFEILKEMVRNKEVSPSDILFFVGYSGWEPKQLEREIKDESWIVTDTTLNEVMKQSGKTMWADVLKERGKALKILSNFPADPALN